ncbi:hypothetical protein SN15_00135 [Stenotrophomonas maltophilia]|nr:hypothetical protein SN15_00135 [Stenotrophomonas maltophilia]
MRHAANVPYRDGTFTGLVRDGRPWEGVVENVDIIYKKFSGAVTEGALARPGGSRLQRDASVTPFQKLLSVRQSDFQRGVPGAPMGPNDETLRRKVLGQACTFTELDARQKHDVNNDPQRRFFDTVFARKLLVNTLSRHEDALRDYSDSLLTFYRDDLLAA